MNLKTKLFGTALVFASSMAVGMTAFADSIYTVKSGDTLSQIAYDYLGSASSYEKIAAANHIPNADLIYVGQKLNLSSDGKISEATAKEVATEKEVETVEEAAYQPEQNNQPETNVVNEAPASGRTMTVEATAYDGYGMGGMTATGYQITSPNDKVIAVDPSVIPLGSTVYIPGYGTATAVDTGGVIIGNIIDLNMGYNEAIQWGRRNVTITIL